MVQFLTPRPWLALYGNHVQIPKQEQGVSQAGDEPPICQLPAELLLHILNWLDPYSLGRAAAACRQWRITAEHPRLWEAMCEYALRSSLPDRAAMQALLVSHCRFSWKRLFVQQPHLRYDGLYVGRNTYVRTGVAEFRRGQPVFLVAYYRYFRFLPDGSFCYRTSPYVLAKVAASLAAPPPGGGPALPGACPRSAPVGPSAKERPGQGPDRAEQVLRGRYVQKGCKVLCALLYPNSRSTELRLRLGLRSTRAGANDRLDVEAIVTYDKELGAVPVQPEPDSEPDAPAAGMRAHGRGMAPAVFVPWQCVASSPLNLPAHEMDFMIA